jgi:FeS assembly SUF system protein
MITSTAAPYAEDFAFAARAGEAKPGICPRPCAEDVLNVLKDVYDPEIPVNIVDLGLIYALSIDEATGNTRVVMTLTSPNCPAVEFMPDEVAHLIADQAGIGAVGVELTWEPTWSPDRMSEEAKLMLDLPY